jgi:two-component system response regulator HydG
LQSFSVRIPLLRERKDDILLLADYFLKKYSDKNKKMIKGFAPRTIDLLMRHPWPGNVRELENAVERSVILAREEVLSPEYLPDAIKELDKGESVDSDGFSAGQSLKEVEKQMILRTLEDTNGNRTHAADILGISRRTLQLKLKKYNIQ